MKLKFHTLDVFTTRKFAGNPLAVVLDADDLTTEQMQTITKEFNLSETTFVMKPQDPSNTAKMRIFFPGGEMPFAGHPTLGTAILLAELQGLDLVKFELIAGLTPVTITRHNGTFEGLLTAPKIPSLDLAPPPNVTEVAQALNVAESDVGFDRHHSVVTRGAIGFLCVPLKTRKALEKSKIIEPHWSALLSKVPGLDAAYLYTRGGDHPDTHYRARMYAPTGGIPEDPATGSATVQLAAQLLTAETLKSGTHIWNLEQGYEMGRPSDLRLEADVSAGKLMAVRVAGSAVRMMTGQIEI